MRAPKFGLRQGNGRARRLQRAGHAELGRGAGGRHAERRSHRDAANCLKRGTGAGRQAGRRRAARHRGGRYARRDDVRHLERDRGQMAGEGNLGRPIGMKCRRRPGDRRIWSERGVPEEIRTPDLWIRSLAGWEVA